MQAPEVSDAARSEVSKLSEDGRISSSDVSGDKELRRVMRDLGQRSLYFFAKAILGYRDLEEVPHKRLCSLTQDYSHRWQAMFLPRGTFKTTFRTISDTIFHATTHPEDTNLIISQTDSLGNDAITEIQAHLEGNNPLMNWLFPEMIKGSDKVRPWNNGAFNFPHRQRKTKTASVVAMGMTGRLEGQHFTILRPDDPIGEEDLNQPASMATKIAKYGGIYSYFERPSTGIIRLSGTRWGLSDLYSLIVDDSMYEVIHMPAEDPLTGELMFPTILSHDFLDYLKRTDYMKYLTQYMNDVTNAQAMEFKNEWIREYELLEENGEPVCRCDGTSYKVSDGDVVLAVDPAGSGDTEGTLITDTRRGHSKKSNNAVVVWLRHRSGRYFMLDSWSGRAQGENPELQIANEMFKLYMRWRGYIRCGFVESFGAQRALITIFNMVCQQQGIFLRMEEIPRGLQKAKKVRIRTYLGAPAQAGVVFIRRSHTAFRFEFTHFGQTDQLDVIDASAWAFSQLQVYDDESEEARNAKMNQRRRTRMLQQVGDAGY
jgi:hypothetical protein